MVKRFCDLEMHNAVHYSLSNGHPELGFHRIARIEKSMKEVLRKQPFILVGRVIDILEEMQPLLQCNPSRKILDPWVWQLRTRLREFSLRQVVTSDLMVDGDKYRFEPYEVDINAVIQSKE